MILDATAGYRSMWKGKTQNVLFLDKRKMVKPDIVASNEQMPFRNNFFEKIVYDPPHLIRNSPIKSTSLMAKFADKFSYWKKKSHYYRNVIHFQREAYRTLKGDGLLILKHTESPDNLITTHTITSLMDSFVVKRTRRQKTNGWGGGQVTYTTLEKRRINDEAVC